MGRLAQKTISTHSNLRIDFSEMCLARPDFVDAVIELRKKQFIRPELFLRDNPSDENETNSYFDNGAVDEGVRSLLKQFSLPTGWFEVVYFYVISSGVLRREGMFEQNESGVVIKEDSEKEPIITIEVGSEATRSDFISAWDHIVRKRGKMVRKNVREKAPRDLRIFELHREGKTIKEIDATIKSEYGEDLDYGHIKKTVSSIYSRHHTPQQMRQELLT